MTPPTPRFSHLLDQLMEPRKVLDYKDGVTVKAVSRGHPNEETYKGGPGGSRMLSSGVFSRWNQDMWGILLAYPCVHQPGSSSELGCGGCPSLGTVEHIAAVRWNSISGPSAPWSSPSGPAFQSRAWSASD